MRGIKNGIYYLVGVAAGALMLATGEIILWGVVGAVINFIAQVTLDDY